MEKEQADCFALLNDKTELVHLIDRLLTDLLSETKGLPRAPSPFDCREIPAISVLDYLKRTAYLTQVSQSTLAVQSQSSWQL